MYQTNYYFVFALYILYSNFSMAKNSSRKTIESSKQAHNAKKTESVKNKPLCSNVETSYISVTPTILKKIRKHRKFLCQSCVKTSEFYHTSVIRNSATVHKSFCF